MAASHRSVARSPVQATLRQCTHPLPREGGGGAGRTGLLALVLLAFIFAAAGTVIHHEMWRDELQAWMVARDSDTLLGLFRNTRYEGHPPLWHFCLFLLSKVNSLPVMMQAFHLLIAAGSAFLALRFAPFPRSLRVLFVFGYIPFYEFCVKSRGYALGVFLSFLFCVLLERLLRPDGSPPVTAPTTLGRKQIRHGTRPTPRSSVLLFGLILGMLCLTSVIGAFIAVGFAVVLAGRLHRGSSWQLFLSRPDVLAGFLVFLVALAVSAFWMIPPADGGYATETILHFEAYRYASVISRLTHAFLPLPSTVLEPTRTSWDHPAAYPILCWSVAFFWRRRSIVLFYGLTTLALLTLLYVKYFGLFWHHAHFFLFWFLSLWLARQENPHSTVAPSLRRVGDWSIAAVLVVHAYTGIAAHVRDWKHPFSAGKATAAFLEGHRLARTIDDRSTTRDIPGTNSDDSQQWLLAGDLDFVASTVVGYLPVGQSMFYIAGERYGTFIRWDLDRLERAQPGWEAAAAAAEEGYRRRLDVLFVSSYELPGQPPNGVREVFRAQESIWPDERYHVYEVLLPR